MSELTDAEREALWEAIERAYLDTTTWDREVEDNIEHVVEAILAAHVRAAVEEAVGPVRALADEWAEFTTRKPSGAVLDPHYRAGIQTCRTQLRAALPDPRGAGT